MEPTAAQIQDMNLQVSLVNIMRWAGMNDMEASSLGACLGYASDTALDAAHPRELAAVKETDFDAFLLHWQIADQTPSLEQQGKAKLVYRTAVLVLSHPCDPAPALVSSPEVRLATFNLGLLQFRTFGKVVKESPPFVEQRFPFICSALASCTAHIVAIQEVYEGHHVGALLDAVKDKYPYHARFNNHEPWQFHNGLLFLSQFPIEKSSIKKAPP